MAVSDLALSWKDHHDVLVSAFERLLEKEALVDCTLAAEGKFLKAHKIVLSAFSPYFQALLNQENDKHPIIFLRDVHFHDLKTIVEFVYSGEVSVPENHVVELLNLAEALQIKGLGGVENKDLGKEQHTEETEQCVTTSPVLNQRLHRDSKYSDSTDNHEILSDHSMQRKEVEYRSAAEFKIANVNNIKPSYQGTAGNAVDELQLVKEEIIDIKPTESRLVSSDLNVKIMEEISDLEPSECHPASSDLNVALKCSEANELLLVKSGFEEVFCTEEYSEDTFEGNYIKSVVQPANEGSSSSHPEYATDPLGKIEIQTHYVESKQQVSRGFSSDLFNAGEVAVETPPLIARTEETSPDGYKFYKLEIPSTSFENNVPEKVMSVTENSEKSVKVLRNSVVVAGKISGLKKNQCSICLRRCRSAATLKIHLCSEVKEQRYQCSHCSKAFSDVWRLRCHLRVHTGEQPYQCKLCLKRYSLSKNLKRHLRIHTGERKHQCTICSRGFIEYGTLQRHLLTHSGEKNYQCTICSKRFSLSGSLTKHLRIHSGEKKYQCTFCSKRFHEAGSLTKHRRIHTGEMNYQCTFCSKRFTESGNLKKHIYIHTGETPFKCAHCSESFRDRRRLNLHLRIHN